MTNALPQTGRPNHVAASIAVPLLLAVLGGIQLLVHRPVTEYLLLPPLAVVIYPSSACPAASRPGCARSSSFPASPQSSARSLALPRMSPPGVALATLVVLGLHFALRAQMPPALAIAVLAFRIWRAIARAQS
jgi:hypothetical protein